MVIPIEQELKAICQEIFDKALGLPEWSKIESGDMFQQGNFIGGFDADEQEFCFSYFATNKNEYWFQFSLETAEEISQGIRLVLVGRPA
ncbi:hypothetical protein [Glaciecola sp. 1036]|uniref:hypothetical protein n=1 Tax=Alteromonadaceae TaxID=72275 RepID=UPI003D0133C6